VIPDLAPVKAALQRGRGLLMLVGHLGNWEVFAVLAGRIGFPTTVLVKTIRGNVMNDFVAQMRARYGVDLLPQRGAYRQCLRVLKGNRLLSVILDQNMTREEGIFVEFFGQPACTSPGLAHLAAQSGAPVLPACCIRRPDGRFEIQLGELLEPPPSRDPDAVREATQQYTRILEAMIRRHPEQWIWIHRRWRTRPMAYADGDGGRDGGAPREKGLQSAAATATVSSPDRRLPDE
jgi:Kdo2-lipid IVA lauroyltransferase/acyltransferase